MSPTVESAVVSLLKWFLRLVIFLVLWFASILVLSGTGRLPGSVEVMLLAVLIAAGMVIFHVVRRRRTVSDSDSASL